MHTQLNLRMQKINSNAFDNFLPEERDEYLNLAINRFIKNRFIPEANYLQEGFEQSPKRYADLRTLVVKDKNLSANQVTGYASIGNYFADNVQFPNDYNFLITIRCEIHYSRSGVSFTLNAGKREVDGIEGTDYKTKTVPVKLIQSDDIYAVLSDPFNKTKINNPLADISDSGVNVYTDDNFVVDNIILNYLKKPVTVSLSTSTDSDLPEQTHDEIVDMAAKLMLSDIGALGKGEQIKNLEKVE